MSEGEAARAREGVGGETIRFGRVATGFAPPSKAGSHLRNTPPENAFARDSMSLLEEKFFDLSGTSQHTTLMLVSATCWLGGLQGSAAGED